MTVFYFSDTHFAHKNIVKGCSSWPDTSKCRDFKTLADHNKALVDNINAMIMPQDTLYHLGDWSFGGVDNIKHFRDMIDCKNIHLILGNHDEHIKHDSSLCNLFTSVRDMYTDYKKGIVMCHYPFQVWENNARGFIMLHGHSHNNVDHTDDGKILDVCPEGHNNRPWAEDEVMAYMQTKPIVAKDHHK